MPTTDRRYPKLRAVDVRPIVQGGQAGILLRDPLQLSDRMVVVPQPLHLALALCDGTREDARALSASLAVRHGVRVAPDVIDQLLQALDEAFLLDNAAAAQAREQALRAYREAPFRPPAGAGQSYPADADALRRLLDGYLDAARDEEILCCPFDEGGHGGPPLQASAQDRPALATAIRGLVSPHIDYARGGPAYARVWGRAAEAVRAADLAVVLGTDHSAGGWLTLTRQHYATPFGVLPTARDVVDALAAAVGEGGVDDELHHRGEHSVELAVVWLHHMRGGEPCPMVPILCGPLCSPAQDGGGADNLPVAALVEAFRAATGGRRVLVVAAGDLAHAGPAFGGRPLGLVERAQVGAADDALIARMCAGDTQGFLDAIRRVGDRYNVCGVPPIYLALRLLHPTRGEQVAYQRCPADGQGTSLVTVCGIVFW